MKLAAFSIFDEKAQIFHAPFFAINDEVAKRNLKQLANDLDTWIGRNPEDYTLYSVGTWDDQKGEFVQQVPISFVAKAVYLVGEPKQDGLFELKEVK